MRSNAATAADTPPRADCTPGGTGPTASLGASTAPRPCSGSPPGPPAVLSADPARGTATSPACLASLSCLKLSQTPRKPGGGLPSWGRNPRGGRGPRRMWSEQPAHPGQSHLLGRAALLTASFSKETGSDQEEAHYPQRSLGRGSVCRPARAPPHRLVRRWHLLPPQLVHFSLRFCFPLKLTSRHAYTPLALKGGFVTHSLVHTRPCWVGPHTRPPRPGYVEAAETEWPGGKLWSLGTRAADVLM